MPSDAHADTPVGATCTVDSDCGRCARCGDTTHTCAVEPITALFAGHRSTCFLGPDGTRWCAGENFDGDLGLGDMNPHLSFTRVVGETGFTNLFLGYNTSWGLRSDGNLYQWGNFMPSITSQGSSAGISTIAVDGAGHCTLFTDGHLDCDPLGSTTWAQVDVSEIHQCAVDLLHAIYCWGQDTNGSLGLGVAMINTVVTNPTRVGSDNDWAEVSAGFAASCGRKTNGTVYCWGDSNYTGTGGVDTMATPTQVGTDTTWTKIWTQYSHTCGVKSDGVWCWGDDTFGGLVAPNTNSAASPVLATPPVDEFALGGHHACRRIGATWSCFGWNGGGQIGIDSPATTINDFTNICP